MTQIAVRRLIIAMKQPDFFFVFVLRIKTTEKIVFLLRAFFFFFFEVTRIRNSSCVTFQSTYNRYNNLLFRERIIRAFFLVEKNLYVGKKNIYITVNLNIRGGFKLFRILKPSLLKKKNSPLVFLYSGKTHMHIIRSFQKTTKQFVILIS